MAWWRRERRAKPLTSADLVELLGGGMGTDSGVFVSERSAVRSTAVWRSVSILSGLVAALPLKAYRPVGDGGREEIPFPLLERPHPAITRYELLERVMVHLLLSGNAYLLRVPNELGTATVQLLPIDPAAVTPEVSVTGVRTYIVAQTDGTTVTLTDAEIVHIAGMGWDGVRGWSPVATMRQAIGLGLGQEEYAARFFGSGAMIGGVLQTDAEMTQEQADDARRSFTTRVSGLASSHTIAILQRGLQWQPTGITPEDSQLIESRQMSVQDVARIYGLPPHLLADVAGSTSWGSGIETLGRHLLVFTLQPWLQRIEGRLTHALMVPPTFIEFTRAGLLEADLGEKHDAYASALAAGWMTVDEVRQRENLPPMRLERVDA